MRVLVTGGTGFVGKHLVRLLLEKGIQVFVGYRNDPDERLAGAIYQKMDVTDASGVKEIVREAKPDGIVHLASVSTIKACWENPAAAIAINTMSVLYLIEAIKRYTPHARLITVGSCHEYGDGRENPKCEIAPCYPGNPYAVSKYAMGQLVLQIAKNEQLNAVHVRAFNHFGPGQKEGFVMSDIASQVARIEQNMAPPVLKVGNMAVRRDYTDVRDVVQAYARLLESKNVSGVYNVCFGRAYSVKEIVEAFLKHASVEIRVEERSDWNRSGEPDVLYGCNEKIRNDVGWAPRIPFEQSVLDTLNWWREVISARSGR